MSPQLNVTDNRREVVLVTSDAQAGGVPLGRLCEIEQGEGPPATELERKAMAKLTAHLQQSPSWQRMEKAFAAAGKVVAKLESEKAVEGLRIYKAAPPAQQRRMAHMTGRQIVALHRLGALSPARPGRNPRPVAREPRRRQTVRRAHGVRAGPDEDSDEPPPPLGGFQQSAHVRPLEAVGR